MPSFAKVLDAAIKKHEAKQAEMEAEELRRRDAAAKLRWGDSVSHLARRRSEYPRRGSCNNGESSDARRGSIFVEAGDTPRMARRGSSWTTATSASPREQRRASTFAEVADTARLSRRGSTFPEAAAEPPPSATAAAAGKAALGRKFSTAANVSRLAIGAAQSDQQTEGQTLKQAQKRKEVRQLLELYSSEERRAMAKDAPAKATLRQLAIKSGGDGSFTSVLKMYYPSASTDELQEMLAWVEEKQEEEQLTEEQRREVKRLFDGIDKDHSDSVELAELQEMGWGGQLRDLGGILQALFTKHDTQRCGSLDLEQFVKLVQDCSLLDKNFLEAIAQRQARVRQAKVFDTKHIEEQMLRGSGTQRPRPCLEDLMQLQTTELERQKTRRLSFTFM